MFFQAFERELGALPFIAEDLGMITPDVYALRDQFQLAGNARSSSSHSTAIRQPYLPHNYVTNRWCTPARTTIPRRASWFEELPDRPAAEPLEISEAAQAAKVARPRPR